MNTLTHNRYEAAQRAFTETLARIAAQQWMEDFLAMVFGTLLTIGVIGGSTFLYWNTQ